MVKTLQLSIEKVFWKCPKMTPLSTAGVQWAVLPGDDGRPLWDWGVRGCWEVLPVSQRQSRDLPCAVEPQKWAPTQPPTRSALSNVVPFCHHLLLQWYHKVRNGRDYSCSLSLSLSLALFVFLICHCFSLSVHSFFISSCTGYQGPDFDWADYLKQCEAEAAPQHCFPTVSQRPFYPFYTKFTLARLQCKGLSHAQQLTRCRSGPHLYRSFSEGVIVMLAISYLCSALVIVELTIKSEICGGFVLLYCCRMKAAWDLCYNAVCLHKSINSEWPLASCQS